MRGALAQSVAILLEQERDATTRFQDLAISFRLCDVDPTTREWLTDTDEELLEVGGRWDRRAKTWAEAEPHKTRILRVHRGQEAPARWLAAWFERRAIGPSGPQWSDFHRVYTLMMHGGRRGGKTHLACIALAMFACMVPKARIWAISPTQEETDELEQNIRDMLPRRWYRFRGGGSGKPLQFRLANGARIFCLSGNKPRTLKRGRVDFALYNEAQDMQKEGWIQIRGAIADNGGLVLMACNPPRAEIGRWIEDVYEQARAEKNFVTAFPVNAKNNPFVEWAALASIEADINDEVTYRREVLGEFMPIGDIVFHAWSDAETVREVPAHYQDITLAFTRQHLGRPYLYIVGMDFQKTPHMVASVGKVFIDPAEPEEPIYWLVDEIVAEDSNEDELLDALEAMPRWRHNEPRATESPDDYYHGHEFPENRHRREGPVHCAVVMDASGFFQDGEHKVNRTSEKWLRARRWEHLYHPVRDSKRNPDIVERCKATNARLKAANGKRRLFSCRHLVHTNRAMRSWENRNGFPYRNSPFAHICDAVSYPIHRFFARPPRGKATEPPPSVQRQHGERRRGFDGVI